VEDRFKFRALHKPTNRLFDVYGFNEHFVFENSLDGVGTSETLPAKLEDCELMQCTGLKDKNGKFIFEGDIVTKKYITPIGELTNENDLDFKKEIKFLNGCFGIYTNTEFKPLQQFINCFVNYESYIPNGGYRVVYDDCNMVVLGNIYENPELL